MAMDKQTSSCQVKRIGEVVRLDNEGLLIQVREQVIPIAAHKADPGLRVGDRVEWTGGIWRAVIEPA
jgi:hypothetical protein